ncbi:MAG: EF-hand domain-containing protein [Tateyamaria sp.]|nr:EF-hand domain-containing protein [Tateyamaria sp.]
MKNIMICTLAATTALAFSPVMAKNYHNKNFEFFDLDTNSDSQITITEIEMHMAAQFAKSDSNNDGSLSLEELMTKVETRRVKKAEKRVKRMLNKLDSDDSGTLEFSEMQNRRGGATRMLRHLDKNEDGVISQTEFDNRAKKPRDRKTCKNEAS